MWSDSLVEIEHPTATLRVVGPLRCTVDAHWALLPLALRRVERFCTKYPVDVPWATLREFILHNFKNPLGTNLCLVVLMDAQGQLVGHAVGSIEPRGDESVALVIQFECDQHVPLLTQQALREMGQDWARSNHVQVLEAITWLPERVYRRYGFTPHRHVVRMPVEEASS